MCVLVKIRVSSISLYKLDTDKLTAPFESAHQFTLVCTVSDSKTVPGCHYNLCSNHSFVWSRMFFFVLRALRKYSCHDRDSPALLDPPPMIEFLELHACSVRIKGRHALKWGTCSNSNTEQQYSIQWQDREQALVSS